MYIDVGIRSNARKWNCKFLSSFNSNCHSSSVANKKKGPNNGWIYVENISGLIMKWNRFPILSLQRLSVPLRRCGRILWRGLMRWLGRGNISSGTSGRGVEIWISKEKLYDSHIWTHSKKANDSIAFHILEIWSNSSIPLWENSSRSDTCYKVHSRCYQGDLGHYRADTGPTCTTRADAISFYFSDYGASSSQLLYSLVFYLLSVIRDFSDK